MNRFTVLFAIGLLALSLFPSLALAAKPKPLSAKDKKAQREANLMIKQVDVFNKSIKPYEAQWGPLLEARANATEQCVNTYLDSTEADPNFPRPSDGAGFDMGFILMGLMFMDQIAYMGDLADVQFTQSATRLNKLKITDPALKLGRREKVEDLKAIQALPVFDLCQLVQDWGATGFSNGQLPQIMATYGLPTEETAQDTTDAKWKKAAAKRMKQVRIPAKKIKAWDEFPLG